MADPNQIGLYDVTAPTPIVYVHIVKPRRYHEGKKDQGNPYFETTWLLDDAQYAAAAQIAANVARTGFPGRDFSTLKFPFQKGDKFAEDGKHDWARGKVLLQARSPSRPRLGVALNGRVTEINRDDDSEVAANQRHFYNGVLAVGSLNFVTYDGFGGGVKAYVNQVVSLAKGDKIAGGQSLEDRFGGFIGIQSDVDPTAGSKGLDGIL